MAAADALVCEAIRGLAQTSTLDLERISSSDGQRYPIIGRSALAGFAAREAGYRRRMVTWMIWINEQYAHFGSKVISVTEREGLHTLDAIVLAVDGGDHVTGEAAVDDRHDQMPLRVFRRRRAGRGTQLDHPAIVGRLVGARTFGPCSRRGRRLGQLADGVKRHAL